MPIKDPEFVLEDKLLRRTDMDDETWDKSVFGTENIGARVAETEAELTFEITETVRGHEVKFTVTATPMIPDEAVRANFDVRIYSDRLVSMLSAFLKLAGIEILLEKLPAPASLKFIDKDGPAQQMYQIREDQADTLVKLLLGAAEPKIAVLALAQQCSVLLRGNRQQHRRLRHVMVTLCEMIGETAKAAENKDMQDCFILYAYALLLRLCQDEPLDWGAYHRATLLAVDTIVTRNLKDEIEILWNAVLAVGLRHSEERLDAADIAGLVEDEIEEIGKLGLRLFLRSDASAVTEKPALNSSAYHRSDWKADEKVSINFQTPLDTIVCGICWCEFNRQNPPVTFNDGKSVCRGCVQKKRVQLTQAEKLRGLGRMNNLNIEDEPIPLSDVFGSSQDLTMSRVVEIIEDQTSNDVDTDAKEKSLSFKRIGGSLYRDGKFAQAVATYTEAIRSFPFLAVNFSNRSAAYVKMKKHTDAYEDAKRAIQLSNGRWGKAHFRLFDSCAPVPLSKGAMTRLRAKLVEASIGSNGEDTFEGLEREMNEDEYLQTWKKHRSLLRKEDMQAWLMYPRKQSIEAAASLVRAYVLGEKVENRFRRTLTTFLLADASLFDGIADDLPSAEVLRQRFANIRRSSLVLGLVRELVQSRYLNELLRDSDASSQAESLQGLDRSRVLDIKALQNQYRSEFDCTLCYSLLCEPTTFPCGHSFCLSCAVRAMDHSTAQGEAKCPMCRASLKAYIDSLNDLAYQHSQKYFVLDIGLEHVQFNQALDGFIRFVFPEEYKSRLEQTQKEEEAVVEANEYDDANEANIPLIHYDMPSLPHIPVSFVLWEPAERLMMRRLAFLPSKHKKDQAHALTNGKFGICWESNGTTCPNGVLAVIDNFSATSEGGLLVYANPENRFQLLSEGSRDGYKTGHIRLLDEKVDPPSRSKVDEWKKSFAEVWLMQAVIDKERASSWKSDSEILLTVALEQYFQAARQLNAEFAEDFAENMPSDALPYLVAHLLQFPGKLNYYLMFSEITRESHKERLRFVLRAGNANGEPFDSNGNWSKLLSFYPELEHYPNFDDTEEAD